MSRYSVRGECHTRLSSVGWLHSDVGALLQVVFMRHLKLLLEEKSEWRNGELVLKYSGNSVGYGREIKFRSFRAPLIIFEPFQTFFQFDTDWLYPFNTGYREVLSIILLFLLYLLHTR